MTAPLYLEHLTDADLHLLATETGEAESGEELLTYLHANPAYLTALLEHPSLYVSLFGSGEHDALLRASPFLVFAVLVHRGAQDLAGLPFVEEWIGPNRRLPSFEVGGLREFASAPLRRFFLAEVLASYTRVASGTVWVQTSRGWRRRRFSELDPLRLLEMLETTPGRERPALYRRLGDLSLFLTGVFPDYAGATLPPLRRQRLQRGMRWIELAGPSLPPDPVPSEISLLEELGQRSYWMAWKATEGMGSGMTGVLADVAESFSQARRLLNFLTDRYLFPVRDHWFPLSSN
jgi:hypothetical protein